MSADQARFQFLEPDSFEWDDRKNASNLLKHGIDFDDAKEVFYRSLLLYRSDRDTEERWKAIGSSNGRIFAVIFTQRGKAIRIISARRPKRYEERAYHNASLERPSKGQD